MSDIFEIDKQYVANTYNRFPVDLVYGKGSLIKDSNGKEYIDLGSGIGVTAFGIQDEEWKKAVIEQLNKIQHASNLYYTEPCANLAKLLCEKTGFKKVFFGNSGAEANECAIKVARKYAEDKGIKDSSIITLKNSFHGRTIATLAATGQDVFHQDFLPIAQGFLYAEANNINSIKELVANNKVSAIMMECVQGEGGVIALNKDFVEDVYKICQEKDILLIIDEVQTGNGRTGKLYAYMNYDITPDVVTTAKGLAGGLPMGACLLGEKVQNTLGPSKHGSTFGGNPIAAAGAISIISRIDEALLNDVKKKSEFIINKLQGKEGILSISGMGLMLGIETKKDVKDVLKYLMDNGVLALSAKTKLRLLPALTITIDELDKACDVIIAACKE
ncbi:MAG: acetylornithine/succinylornithine family transaminase [Clostridiales bacterium]|nr:acetylornithine/succinylornithine family transaminase [Clostridiales bacterium]